MRTRKNRFRKALIICTAALGLLGEILFAQEFHLGAPIAGFTLQGVHGRTVTFQAMGGRPMVVVFFSTRCPMSNAFNYRRNKLFHDFIDRVTFVAIDANSNESLEEIRNYSRDVEFDFPVYRDRNNVVADRFGAQVTTDTFVIDSTGVMRYHGYLEDSPNPTRAKKQGLRLAIEAVLDGKPVAVPETKALGCAIRRIRTGALSLQNPPGAR